MWRDFDLREDVSLGVLSCRASFIATKRRERFSFEIIFHTLGYQGRVCELNGLSYLFFCRA